MEIPLNMLSVQMECTLYFENNPFAYETVDGLSMRLGRKSSDLQQILPHLVSLNILKVIGEGNSAVYHYNQPQLLSEVDLSWNRV